MFEALYNDKLKDLPVNEISDAVMDSVDNNVTIISSPTGSGKTLTIPAKLADKIPDNERVVVLVPRKFLAINAAETVSELSGGTLGEEVGYAVGTQGGDEPLFSKNSKIIFATYGYAIEISNSSAVSGSNNFLAEPRVITPKNGGRSFTIYENVTSLSTDDIKKFILKNPEIISSVDSDKDFHILDSSYISNYELKDFVAEGFNARVANALNILKEKGIAEFKAFIEKNNIPDAFWSDTLKKEQERDLISNVLSIPNPKKDFDLFDILGRERPNFYGTVNISEDKLKNLGLINGNEVNLTINPVVASYIDIQNPDLVVKAHIVGDKSNGISFNSKLKEIHISSQNDNFDSTVSVEGVSAEKISFSNLKRASF